MKVKGKTCIVFDVESFPNIFTCTCKDTETQKIKVFEISIRKNDIQEMCEYFQNTDGYFIGYNNHHFDNIIINYCIEYNNKIQVSNLRWTNSINKLSSLIISKDSNFELYKPLKYRNYYKSIDLLTMLYSKALRVSLKEMQVTMHYKNVLEFTANWQENLDVNRFDELIQYNKNDVESTEDLLKRCNKDLQLREGIEDEYHINCLSLDGVNLGMEILKQEYLQYTKKNWDSIKDLRSPQDVIDLNKVIFPFIKFKTPILQEVLNDMKNQIVSPGRKGYEREFIFGDMIITVGVGGIHGDCGTSIIKPKNNEKLLDWDVASLYPSLMIEHELYPPHLGKEFLEVYKNLRTKRFEAKRIQNKVKDDAFKLGLNGLTGNLQNEYSWCYSPFTVLQIRINGQLLLLMLAEELWLTGCKLKQINTDGVLFITKKDNINNILKVKAEWEQLTNLILEEEDFESFYQLAINDYFGKYTNGKVKEKGTFVTKTLLGKGLAPKIIPEAIINYFLYGIPVKETIESCNDIRKFLQSEKTGKQWTVEYNDKEQQRTNRFYVSESGYYLWKWKEAKEEVKISTEMGYWSAVAEGRDPYKPILRKGEKQYHNMLKGYGVILHNELISDEDINTLYSTGATFQDIYNVNYNYYIIQCQKIIEQLKPRQLNLFDF